MLSVDLWNSHTQGADEKLASHFQSLHANLWHARVQPTKLVLVTARSSRDAQVAARRYSWYMTIFHSDITILPKLNCLSLQMLDTSHLSWFKNSITCSNLKFMCVEICHDLLGKLTHGLHHAMIYPRHIIASTFASYSMISHFQGMS